MIVDVKEEWSADTSGHLENDNSPNGMSPNDTSPNDETLAPTVPGDTSIPNSSVKAKDISVVQGETNVFL
jgi:hypothetical protein